MHATSTRVQATPRAEAAAADVLPALTAFVSFVMKTCGRDFFRAVGELELSLSQLRALHILAEKEDDTSVKALAEHLGLSLPAVSRALEGLVQRGLATRTEDAADRRMKRVGLTEAGRELIDHLVELRVTGLEAFAATLPAGDRRRLQRALAPIVAREDIAAMCPAARTRASLSPHERTPA